MNEAIPQSLLPVVMTILLGAAAAWGAIELRIWRGKPVLAYEPRRPVPWNWIDLLATLLLYFVSQVICVGLAFQWLGVEGAIADVVETSQGRLAVLAATAAAGLSTFLISSILIAWRSGATAHDLGFVSRAIPRDIVYGLVAFFAAAPVVYMIQLFFSFVVKIEYNHPLVTAIQKEADATTIAVVVFTAVVAAPLSEEFLIRVLLQGWLEKLEIRAMERTAIDAPPALPPPLPAEAGEPAAVLSGDRASRRGATGLAGLPLGSVPVLTSSLLFAMMHFGQGAAPIPLFFYALVLGFVYNRTHRIMPSLVAHFALNSASVAMLFLAPVPS
jgi:membrane protease YdiL (CAAX protease family)